MRGRGIGLSGRVDVNAGRKVQTRLRRLTAVVEVGAQDAGGSILARCHSRRGRWLDERRGRDRESVRGIITM